MRAKLLKAFRILPWLLLALTGSFLYFGQGLKDLVEGRGRRIAAEVFRNTEGIDEVRIYRLEGSPEQRTNDSFDGLEVFGSFSVAFEDWDVFIKCWGGQVSSGRNSNMCHEPSYAFRLYRDGKLITETAICWHCENFTAQAFWPLRSELYGFDPNTEAAKKLLAFCDARLPYYRPPPKPTEAK